MSNKIKIAIDLRPLLDPNESGVTVYTKALVDRLLSKHPEYEWILFYQASRRAEHLHQRYPDVQHIQKSNTLFHLRSVFGAPPLPKAYFKEEPDLLWIPDRRPFYASPFPIVLTVHDLIPQHQLGNFSWKGRIWHRLFSLHRLMKNANAILAPSLTVAQSIRTRLPKEVTYEGVEPSQKIEKPSSISEKIVKEGFFFMLAPADPRKRWDWAYEVAKKFPRQHFIFAGLKDKDARFRRNNKLRYLSQLSNVLLLSHVNEAEKNWLYHHAKALFALSTEEGFDLPVLEAVHAHCPVFLSDIPIHRELYRSAEWVKELEDLFALVYKAADFTGKTARKQFLIPEPRGHYSWDSAAERLLLFFLRVLRDKNR